MRDYCVRIRYADEVYCGAVEEYILLNHIQFNLSEVDELILNSATNPINLGRFMYPFVIKGKYNLIAIAIRLD